MKKIAVLFISILSIFCSPLARGKENKPAVRVIPIKGTIDLGLSSFVERALKEADSSNCSAVIFEIDTLGGRVDAALKIRDAIIESKTPTFAFINKRAISAGALIALSTQKIVMCPGGTIGAAKPVQIGIFQPEQKQDTDEKTVSFLRKEFKATAEKNGHPGDVAEAFVDQDVEIKGLIEKGKLLTLTADEALKWKIAAFEAPSLDEALKLLNIPGGVAAITPNWSENVVRFLTHPIVSSLLLTLGIIGIAVELKAPGISLPGIFGTMCILIFFFAQYLTGMAGWIDVIVFAIGLALILLEIFVIPGFGFAGISGIVLMLAGIFLALIKRPVPHLPLPEHEVWNAIYVIGSSLVTGVAVSFILFRYVLPKTQFMSGIILKQDEKAEHGFVSSAQDMSSLLGAEGKAHTMLRPAGKGEFGDKTLDVVTEGDLIEKGSRIKIIEIKGTRIVVKKVYS